MQNSFMRENSKRLKKYFTPFNPILGYPLDPDRFLFNIHGLRKTFLPSNMKNIPLIRELIKRKSLSSFLRSSYFKNNFQSVSQIYLKLEAIRLRYDFPFWISKTYDPDFNFNGLQTLVMDLQKIRSSASPLNIIIRKNEDQDISQVIFLFIIWCKSFGQSHTNVMTVTPSKAASKKLRSFLLDWKESNSSKEGEFLKTDFANSIYHPFTESKFWFVPYHSPGNCRGIDYTVLYFSDPPISKTISVPSLRSILSSRPSVSVTNSLSGSPRPMIPISTSTDSGPLSWTFRKSVHPHLP